MQGSDIMPLVPTPEFVRELQAQGYTDLTPRRVIDLRMTRRVIRAGAQD